MHLSGAHIIFLSMKDYVHGYSEREASRLDDQAQCLDELLHHDTIFPPGSTVLEAGCGVGAQTCIIAPKNSEVNFISIDISPESVAQAKLRVLELGLRNVQFQTADIFHLPFDDESFDHIFICFVLEHLPYPANALRALARVLKRGGSITLIEGDHGSAYFYPPSEAANRAIGCQVELQARQGGDALIGRRLFPLLVESGYSNCVISPRMVYVDASRPAFVEGFIKNTFTAMIEGVEHSALENNLIDENTWRQGIKDLYRTTQSDGTFCYTFFKGVGWKK